jgi:hypothetical protein
MDPVLLVPGQRSAVSLTITQADAGETPFMEIPIYLPPGVTRLDVGFEYAKADDCALDIGILDSSATRYPARSGFRGWSGSARKSFFVATDGATPGYYAGPMPDGLWTVLIGMYRVPESGAPVCLSFIADAAPREMSALRQHASPRRDQPGWYRGDLHCHTFHSDAKGPPDLLEDNARRAGLDFLAVTDHNTTTQWQYFGARSTEDLVFVPGMEVTTYRGHANIFGLTEWIDFRLNGSTDLGPMVKAVRQQGALLSINHDKEPLPWNYDYPDIDCMEVFHGHWLTGNDGVLQRYDRFLCEGRRISLIGGSDYHQPDTLQPVGPIGLGRPTTVVWLPHLDAGSVVDGLRSGCCYVTESPTGPHLTFTANGRPMGSAVLGTDTIEIEVDVKGAAGDRLVWVGEDGPILEEIIPSEDWQTSFCRRVPGKFLRAEIVADASRAVLIAELVEWCAGRSEPPRALQSLKDPPPIRRALSNPVYFDAPQ